MSFNIARCCLEEANINPLSVYRKPSLVTSNAFQILKQWVTNLFCLFRIVTSRRFDCWLLGILLTCAYIQKRLKVFNPSDVLHSEKPEALYLYLQNKKKELIFSCLFIDRIQIAEVSGPPLLMVLIEYVLQFSLSFQFCIGEARFMPCR